MKKYLVLLTWCLFVSNAIAKTNVFCKGEDSLDDYCMVASNKMYEGYMKGFTGSAKKSTKGENWDEKTLLKEAQELIPYSIFHSAFQFCGETKSDMMQAQRCLIKELQKYIVIKVKEQQNAAKEQSADVDKEQIPNVNSKSKR